MSYNSTHTGAEIDDAVSKVKNGVPISNGGTGATTAKQARTNLGLDSLSSFGITATATELNYCDGVTSNIQTQLNSKLNYSEVAGTPTVNPLTVAYGGTGATTPEAALTNLGVVSYIIEDYTDSSTSLNWAITKWSNGRAEARTKSFVETGTLTMTAIGNNYYSNNLTWTLPPGLFVDNTYNVSTEIQSSGSPINTIRQSISTKDEYVCRVQKSNNTTTSVSVKFLVIGRWK